MSEFLKKSQLWQFLLILLVIFVMGGLFSLRGQRKQSSLDIALASLERPLEKQCEWEIPDDTFETMKKTADQAAQSLRQNSDDLNMWMKVGLTRKKACQYEEARIAWEYAGEIRPKNSISFGNLGDLYAHFLNNPRDAEKNYLRAIENEELFYLGTNKSQPINIKYYLALHELYTSTLREKKDLADDILLRGLSVDPKAIDLMAALAEYYEKEGNSGEAVSWYKKALEVRPGLEILENKIKQLQGGAE